jgi:hypothetical protein
LDGISVLEEFVGGVLAHVFGPSGELSDDATADVEDAFDSRAQLTLYKADQSLTDIELQSIEVIIDDASDGAELRVYGGRSPQEAATGTNRTLMLSEDIAPYQQRIVRGVRHRALAVEIWGTSDTGRWAVESVVALGVPCRTIGVMSVKSASLATESQGVPVTTSDDTSDGGGAEAPNIERLLVVSSNGHSSGQGHSNDYIGHVLANSGGGDHGGSVGSSSAIIVVPF